jgi:ribose transport system permease protein
VSTPTPAAHPDVPSSAGSPSSGPTGPSQLTRSHGSFRIQSVLQRYSTVLGLVVLIAFFSLKRPHTFPTWTNTTTILSQGSLLGIIAGGLTICLVLGEFDLSIGYAATLGGVVTAKLINHGTAPWLVVVCALAAGLAIGLVNGLIIAYGNVNAFIATLGTGSIIYGIVLGMTGGAGVDFTHHALVALGQGTFHTVPTPVIIMLIVLAVLWIFLNKTELGRKVDAVGGNADAARLSGIRVARIRLVGFLISGTVAAGAGMLLAAQLGASYSDSGTPYLLEAFTACFLGAVTLRENEFNVAGTLFGVLIIAVTFNGLAQLGVSAFWQNVAQGLILIAAVLGPRAFRLRRRIRRTP